MYNLLAFFAALVAGALVVAGVMLFATSHDLPALSGVFAGYVLLCCTDLHPAIVRTELRRRAAPVSLRVRIIATAITLATMAGCALQFASDAAQLGAFVILAMTGIRIINNATLMAQTFGQWSPTTA